MKRALLIIFVLFPLLSFAQDTATAPLKRYYLYPNPFPNVNSVVETDSSGFFNPTLLHPIIGVGPSILTFYGDVAGKNTTPAISRLGYNLSVSEYLTRSLLFSARAMFGTLGASENNTRNVNFESRIRSGGLNLSYNFDNFLPKKRMLDPFVLTGFEYFEYLSKTDLFDGSGNKYYYWSDGSIMSLDQKDPNVGKAVPLTRDYKYETDIRKWNNSFFGKYP